MWNNVSRRVTLEPNYFCWDLHYPENIFITKPLILHDILNACRKEKVKLGMFYNLPNETKSLKLLSAL